MHHLNYDATLMLLKTGVALNEIEKLTINSFPRQDYFPDNFLAFP